jgi:large subunit ribosomal protein L34
LPVLQKIMGSRLFARLFFSLPVAAISSNLIRLSQSYNVNFRFRGENMHYPRRVSKIKRARKMGFRARMRTRSGRKLINRRRRRGQKVQTV